MTKYITLALLLGGCTVQQAAHDINHNAFIKAPAVSHEMEGRFTGVMGPYLSTYALNADGTGINCYVQNGNTVLHRIKITGIQGNEYQLLYETGLKSTLKKQADGTVLLASYGAENTLVPDEDLTQANLACVEALRKHTS